jgi:hypothetical protein
MAGADHFPGYPPHSAHRLRWNLARRHQLRNSHLRIGRGVRAMSKSDAGFDFDHYRKLLAEANDEPKRMALIDLLVEEKAKDQLAEHSLQVRLTGLGLTKPRG